MTVYEALVVVSQGNYQDIPECRAKKNLLLLLSALGKI